MKIVIKEWLKCKRAILVLLVTVFVSGIKSWTVVRLAVDIPRVIEGGSTTASLMMWVIAVSALAIVMDIVYIVLESKSYRMFYTDTCTRFAETLLDAKYELYTKYSLAWITGAQNFIQDASTAGKMVIRISSNIIHMVLNVGAIIVLAPQVLLPISGLYVLMVILVWPLYKKIGLCSKAAKDAMRDRDQIIENDVYGFSEVRVNNTQDYELRRIKLHNQFIYYKLNQKNRYNGWLMLGASGMDGLGTIVAIIYIIDMIAKGQLSIATGVAIVTMVGSLLGGLMNVLDLVDGCSDITARSEQWDRLMKDASVQPNDGHIYMSPLSDSIEIKNVNFTYGETGSILNGCSLKIKAGTKVGICGRSGDGKTTLLKLLCKFYEPRSGNIEFDGTDLRDIRTNSIYNQISIVSQEINIFPGTILENITYGRPGVTEHAVLEACKKAELYDFVMGLPLQLHTEVGPRGVKLSGGQRQRVALARMFLRDPSIIILDEATSALDNTSERAVQRAIEKMKGKTIIMVAHRLSTIENCDEIFVMENGMIAEHGTSEELKAMNGIYSKMLSASVEE